jgi:hypothetical protein
MLSVKAEKQGPEVAVPDYLGAFKPFSYRLGSFPAPDFHVQNIVFDPQGLPFRNGLIWRRRAKISRPSKKQGKYYKSKKNKTAEELKKPAEQPGHQDSLL